MTMEFFRGRSIKECSAVGKDLIMLGTVLAGEKKRIAELEKELKELKGE